MKYLSDIFTTKTLKLSIPLLIIFLIIASILLLFFYKKIGGKKDIDLIGIDLTSVDDIKTMRSEMTDLAVGCVKYIRNNYNQKMPDIANALWSRRGNSDQWTMAIATKDIDNYKAGDIIWCGDPGLLCSGDEPFCNISKSHLAAIKKDPDGHIQLNDLIKKDSALSITLEAGSLHGTTWIVSFSKTRTQQGAWLKRSEGLAYPIHDRRIMLFIFGIYDYTGILYDFDQDFQDELIKAFGIKK